MARPLSPLERGQLVVSARKARRWSQVKLSEASGVDRSTLSKVERGEISGSLDTYIALAGPLDIDLNLLKGPAFEDMPTEPEGRLVAVP